jgi:predicted nucleic acid-binding protein
MTSPTKICSTVSGEAQDRGLIDTNVAIHLAALDGAHLLSEMMINAVTLAELSAGPHHTENPAERARRMSVLQHTEATFEPLPFDTEKARTFGLVSAAVVAAGCKPRHRIADLMIAPVAIASRLALYDHDPPDAEESDPKPCDPPTVRSAVTPPRWRLRRQSHPGPRG